ncbi:ubiquitin carboxyl-terminal hydrolase-like [Raphidocelis subcapitata]|uniref:Ubiquitin carboxyl-terminal hydrolase n=1 Tax=Raphidocelis subcapitata TaxID=307507 RepID=A0A2V0P160_9CHLO|nr:ubiquitin carboxyl-terminal hydrolase-like [Raphidocelis subcapitata]|eukprot:GBF91570.1 ubiquitin carboxyl-terminal hydrolase-like [Raphidocelis subcapitata]
MTKKWLPLESNPEVMTEFAARIGLDTSKHAFYDVFGLDEELLAMVPQPVVAVLLLYPITAETEAAAKEADGRIAAAGPSAPRPPPVYFMKQTIGNACGTIAMLHAFGNSLGTVELADGSFLRRFFDATEAMTPEARGAYLEAPPSGAPDIEEAHQAAGERGDTAPPQPEEDVDLHFVAFVNAGGQLVELDGRRGGPVAHGPTSADGLLADAAAVVRREFMEKSSSIAFNLICLSKAEG